MSLLNYTNGVGHLIMSIFLTCVGLALVLYPGLPASTNGVGIGIILAVQAAWIVPGAAKQMSMEMQKQLPTTINQAVQSAIALNTPIDATNMPTQKIPAVKA